MSKETRDRIAFRMQPETRRRIEQWYAADNCQSKNEFIEKAVNFYVDYLGIVNSLGRANVNKQVGKSFSLD